MNVHEVPFWGSWGNEENFLTESTRTWNSGTPAVVFKISFFFFFGRINFKSICAYKRSSQCKSKELIPYLKVGRT